MFLSLSTSAKNVTLGFTCLKSLYFVALFHIVDQATRTTHEKFGCRVLVSCDQFFCYLPLPETLTWRLIPKLPIVVVQLGPKFGREMGTHTRRAEYPKPPGQGALT